MRASTSAVLLAVIVALVAAAAVTGPDGTASSSRSSAVPKKALAQLSAASRSPQRLEEVKRFVQRQTRSRGTAKAIGSAKATSAVAATTFVGYAWCDRTRIPNQPPATGETPAGRMQVWAAYDPMHQWTVTFHYIITSTSPTLTPNTVAPAAWYNAGSDLNHFYQYWVSNNQLRYASTYARAFTGWVTDQLPEYDQAVNAIYFFDNGVWSGPNYALVETTGPQGGSTSPTCSFQAPNP